MFRKRPTGENLDHRLNELLALITPDQHPNANALWRAVKEIPMISLNIKAFGYELARQLAEALPVRTDLVPQFVGLHSKPSTQTDLEQDWVAYWASQLQIPVVFHRKIWELTYILQAIHEHGQMVKGASGVGFGCGVEPLPSLLASRGIKVLVTDLAPSEQESAGWVRTNQHASVLQSAYRPNLVTEVDFERNVSFQIVDMNLIPNNIRGFDFCWSICALEHLGSIRKGLDFIRNSLDTVRPGGIAVHTTEFNFLDDDKTIDNWPTVLFQRQHFQQLHDELTALGHAVSPLDFDVGSRPLDKFIDIPPFVHDWPRNMVDQWGDGTAHLKVSVDGFAATCFGIIIRKKA